MVSLQCGFGASAGQTSVAVTFAERCELSGVKTARTGVPRGPPLTRLLALAGLTCSGLFPANRIERTSLSVLDDFLVHAPCTCSGGRPPSEEVCRTPKGFFDTTTSADLRGHLTEYPRLSAFCYQSSEMVYLRS